MDHCGEHIKSHELNIIRKDFRKVASDLGIKSMNGLFLEKYFKEVSIPRKENCTNKQTNRKTQNN